MKIEDLTLKQLKEIGALFGAREEEKQHPFVGKYVVARCYAAGVHVGKVQSVDGENVILENSIRLWSWRAKDGVALSGVAQNGIEGECKIDTVNPLIYLAGVCELIPISEASRASMYG